jgi:3-methylcrotonyl-CoA carboxylase alpha subunit
MGETGVPIVPGYHGEDQSLEALSKDSGAIGFPVLIKASAGGGGKGMRVVRDASELLDAIEAAHREAERAFGNGMLLLEKYIDRARHVEVQILGDHHGNLIHLFERECSIQRRHQKLIEESPVPRLAIGLKERLIAAAVAGARAVRYVNAGTMEFIVTGEQFYFLEMNTRLQVEHPVTEEVTGVDLVQWQLRVASGEPLALDQAAIHQRGSSIECRIYAEDPDKHFLPSPGRLTRLVLPVGTGIRLECGVAEGVEVSVHYDPLLAKLVASGATREDAVARMEAALDRFVVEGVKTLIPFHRRVMRSAAFRAGAVHTQMVEQGAFNA